MYFQVNKCHVTVMLLITWLSTALLSRDTALLSVTEQKQHAYMSPAIKVKHGLVDIINSATLLTSA